MKNKITIIICKIISIVSLFLILLPYEKISLFYGVVLIAAFIDHVESLNFLSLDFFSSTLSLIGFITIPFCKKNLLYFSYFLAIIGIILYISINGLPTTFWFWFPLMVFIISSMLSLKFVGSKNRI